MGNVKASHTMNANNSLNLRIHSNHKVDEKWHLTFLFYNLPVLEQLEFLSFFVIHTKGTTFRICQWSLKNVNM